MLIRIFILFCCALTSLANDDINWLEKFEKEGAVRVVPAESREQAKQFWEKQATKSPEARAKSEKILESYGDIEQVDLFDRSRHEPEQLLYLISSQKFRPNLYS